ncbi:MAG: hypothetical protein IJH57_03150, partial [Mogibacterium sp.]|nr:hypothetical protein [Mogibacterium sp.]
KVIFDQTEDKVTGIVVEDTGAGLALTKGESVDLIAYAIFDGAAPVKVDATYSVQTGSAFVTIKGSNVTATGAGSGTIKATYKTHEATFAFTVTE